MDGNPDPAYIYNNWESYLITRMAVPSQLEIFMDGAYDQYTYQGNVDISIYNEGSDTLSRVLICVLTESGLYYNAPNGLQWHDHVMRDMIPTNNGTQITLYPQDTTYLNLNFTVDPSWDYTNCQLICFVQHDSLRADSSKDVMQGAKIPLNLLGVEENPVSVISPQLDFILDFISSDNIINISFNLPSQSPVSYKILDISGRILQSDNLGILLQGSHHLQINTDHQSNHAGTYFFVLKTDDTTLTKKIVR